MSYTVDYDSLDTVLARADASAGPSESHGMLCGMLCATSHPDRSAWLASVFEDAAAEHDVLVQEAIAALDQLAEQTHRQLYEGQLAFQLLLPGDDTPVRERAEALSAWCQGYLLGFATGGLDQSSLSEQVRELIGDFVEVTKVDVQDSDEEEGGEEALVNIVEYVRLGVVAIYEELHPASDERPPALH